MFRGVNGGFPLYRSGKSDSSPFNRSPPTFFLETVKLIEP
jgi:hypothetical protein